MLSLILSIALVAAPSPYVAPGVYQAPPRCPDELLVADLPDWAKIVWLAVRKRQGNNETAWAGRKDYAAMTGKRPTQISMGLSLLKAEGWLVELDRNGHDPILRAHVPLTDWRAASSWAPPRAEDGGEDDPGTVNPLDSSVNPVDSEPPVGVNPVDRTVNPLDSRVNPVDTPSYVGESGQGTRTTNPSQPSGSYEEGVGKSAGNSGGDGAGVFVERMEPTRPDKGINGNRAERELAAESPGRLRGDDLRAVIASALPGYEGPPSGPASVPPSVGRSREDAEADAAIAALPPADRSRLLTSATRKAKRQWPGTWPGDRDPSVRSAVARIARELFTAAAEEVAQPQDS